MSARARLRLKQRESEGTAGSEPTSLLQSGARAPDFRLFGGLYEEVSLSEHKGRSIILAFYEADWNPISSVQLAHYNAMLPELALYGALLMGISADSKWSHAAYAQEQHLGFPLLADYEPRGEIARRYGARRRQDGASERALVLVGPTGVVAWSCQDFIRTPLWGDALLRALATISAQGCKQSKAFEGIASTT